ncbi:hypothetical protein CRE_04449, partial [Caenorhabditis remanei]
MTTTADTTSRTEFTVTGMTCGHCEGAITRERSDRPPRRDRAGPCRRRSRAGRRRRGRILGHRGLTDPNRRGAPQSTSRDPGTASEQKASSSMTPTPDPLVLDIGGMTCASCANRIEKKLGKIEGVEASVNYATERATIRPSAGADPAASAELLADPERFVHTVEDLGYRASVRRTAARPAPAQAAPVAPTHSSGADGHALDGHRDPHAGHDMAGHSGGDMAGHDHGLSFAEGAKEADDAELRDLKHRLIGSVILSVPVILMAMIPALQFTNWQWLSLALAAPVITWAAWPFHRATWINLKHGAATMDTLVSVGTGAAFLWSLYALFFGTAGHPGMTHGFELTVSPGSVDGAGNIYLEVAAGVTMFILAGRYFEKRSKKQAGAALRALMELGAQGGHERRRVASYTTKKKKKTNRKKPTGVLVFLSLSLSFTDSHVDDHEAPEKKGDRRRHPEPTVTNAVVKQSSQPLRTRKRSPTALAVGTGRGAQLGILISGPKILESTRRVDTIVLDKTGTVTTGCMALAEAIPAAGEDRAELLRIAGALEAGSEHPIAEAIAAGAREADPRLPEVESFQNAPGTGASGVVDGRAVLVGREALLADWAVAIPEELAAAKAAEEAKGRTAVLVAWDGVARGVVSVSDRVKPTSAEAIRQLRELGLEPVLLTGDHETVAREVAREVGIDRVIAGVMPADKVEVVRGLQAEGKRVAMVGDGVNDAAALAQADLGLAMGTGTDAAIAAADITLVRGDLMGAVDAIRLSRRTLGTIYGNLFWAFAYNVAAIPLAALGLLTPMIALLDGRFSSVVLGRNSLRLVRFRSGTK